MFIMRLEKGRDTFFGKRIALTCSEKQKFGTKGHSVKQETCFRRTE